MTKLISPETLTTWQIWFFSIGKIPLIYFCRPTVVRVSDNSMEVKIKLRRRTRNHLNSMYFGVLSVGDDVTGGFLAMQGIRKSQSKISLIFKDFHADFLKRAEGDVHFACEDGLAIQNLIEVTKQSSERQNLPVTITATVPKISNEVVAKFILTLSLKKQ